MASGRASWFQRYVLFKIPGLYKRRDCGNFHPFWHRLCFCRMHEHCGDWHGGIQDLKTGKEYQECHLCEKHRTVAESKVKKYNKCGVIISADYNAQTVSLVHDDKEHHPCPN